MRQPTKYKIGFDFDGVIWNANVVLCDIIHKTLKIEIRPKDVIEYSIEKLLGITKEEFNKVVDELISVEKTCSINPFPGVLEFLKDWYNLGNNIHIITARWDEEPLHLFFEQHLSDIPICIHRASPKGGIINELGLTHFVDDHLKVIVELANIGVQPIIYDQPYNQISERSLLNQIAWRVFSWADIRKLFIEGG
jgi:uncharacterized HAD superfamily protein